MEALTQRFETPNGAVEGIVVAWPGFKILMITGSKGFLACPAFDLGCCQDFGAAVAIVESGPTNPIGTLERMCDRKITRVTDKARALGIREGMLAKEAFALIA
ncbi:MAG: DUF1805 domain-containing protein [Phycisphaerae bacterium]|nr:DUF1805 domain-containing protein [Phycisphaerae bacterium]